MKKEVKILIFLLFLSPALGELVTGSSPPLSFFGLGLLIMVPLYGCGTLLIREAKARWNLQWSVVFLAVAYGIVEEGLAVKSFFNPGWMALGPISGYGMYFGVQWVWTLMLIGYHATISILIPIAIAEMLWPKYKDVPLLKKRGLFFTFAGIIFATLFGLMVFGDTPMGTPVGDKMVPFYANPLLLIGSFSVVILLIWLAYKYKDSNILTRKIPLFPPFVFGILGFIFQAFYVFLFYLYLPSVVSAPITIFIQLIQAILVLLFVFYQIFHQDITKRHIVSLIFGSILFWILVTPVSEFSLGKHGMFAVGSVAFILLLLWRSTVLKRLAYSRR